ncbi:MAG: hypothetical protein RBU25_17210 [Lentisphaeria bacterium]|jgi:hypothetical protein|nr:hypothetical protein [Lentisphaeria bacterium]
MTGLWTALLLVLQVMAAERRPWIEPLPDVRLEPTLPFRSEADFGPDSAYRLLLRATELPEERGLAEALRQWEENLQYSPWQVAGTGWAESLLRDAEPCLELARRAAVAPDPQVPTNYSFCGDNSDLTTKVGTLTYYLILSAYAKEGRGDPAGAIAELLVCIRCGGILSRGGGISNRLVDIIISYRASRAIHAIATRNDIPAPVLRRYAGELLQISDRVEPCAEAIRHEAKMQEDMFDKLDVVAGMVDIPMLGKEMRGREPLCWLAARVFNLATGSTEASMRRSSAALFQHYVRLASQPYGSEKDARLRALPPRLGPDVACFFFQIEDPMGLVFAQAYSPSAFSFAARCAERDAALRGMALFLAVRAYEVEQRRPPILATDLVPEFLPRLPLDPFDGKPLRYVFGKVPATWGEVEWGIYSIGRDFADDGGRLPDPPSIGPYGRSEIPCDIVWIPRILAREQ